MATLLSRIFGKKTSPAPTPENDDLDISSLRPLMEPKITELDMEITPRETAELLKIGKIKLLDVRTPDEYSLARVEGSILADQAVAQEILQSWPKETAIVTICHHGMRSLDAAAYLRGHGFANTKSMRGGIDAWALQIDSSIPRY